LAEAKRRIPANPMLKRSCLSCLACLACRRTDLKSASKRTDTSSCKRGRSRSSGVCTPCSPRRVVTKLHDGKLHHSTQFRYFFKRDRAVLRIPALLNCTVPGGNCKTRAAFTVKKPNRFMPFRSRPPNGERSLSDCRKHQQRDSLQHRCSPSSLQASIRQRQPVVPAYFRLKGIIRR